MVMLNSAAVYKKRMLNDKVYFFDVCARFIRYLCSTKALGDFSFMDIEH